MFQVVHTKRTMKISPALCTSERYKYIVSKTSRYNVCQA